MKKLLSLCLILLFLTGCTTPESEPVLSANIEPDGQDEIILVHTPTPTATPTEAPTEEPTVVPTPEPTEEPTPEPTATPEPKPFRLLALPKGMRPRRDYAITGLSGVLYSGTEKAYAAYGAFGDDEPAFYPCDEHGAVDAYAEPIDRVMMVPTYTLTEQPKKDGEALLVVYLGSQCVVAFESRDGEWVELRVMICSTGRKRHETPKGSYKISNRYDYKILGTGETNCYGFWASRFSHHLLFHSVPISVEAGKDRDKAHRMCDMHKYEKLGTVASDGCVRLTVENAKWIYDWSENRAVAVRVVGDAGPTPEKPPAVIWEEPYTDKNGYGWDPTDPDPNNPYLQQKTES